MLRIDLSRQAGRFLERHLPKHRRQVIAKIGGLAADPAPIDSRPLEGHPFRRADIGEYRIVYDSDGTALRILVIGKRNDDEVYRILGRR